MTGAIRVTGFFYTPSANNGPEPEWTVQVDGKWSLATVPLVLRMTDIFFQISNALHQISPRVPGKCRTRLHSFSLKFSFKTKFSTEDLKKAIGIIKEILKESHVPVEKKRRNSI